jgi:hypothetical protein
VFSIWKQITALVKEAPEASKTNSLLIRNETQSFLFTKTQLSKYIQISFLDITEEECLLKEIKLMNQQEIKRQNELKRLFDSIKIVEKEQAALDLKYQIHDIIAQRIAILHHFLVQIKAPQSLLEIKTMMKGMFFDIHEHILRPDDKMCHLITSYLRIGVKLKITGENLLKDPQEIRIITKIIREATTNAIRHGGATKVNINITKIDGNTKVIITNNGTLPELINEDHGLGGIREAIKILKGEFKIETQTELRLIIKY